jgi:hypothetical protein
MPSSVLLSASGNGRAHAFLSTVLWEWEREGSCLPQYCALGVGTGGLMPSSVLLSASGNGGAYAFLSTALWEWEREGSCLS